MRESSNTVVEQMEGGCLGKEEDGWLLLIITPIV
jgi:hypothetical protein